MLITSPDFNEDVIAVTALMPEPKIVQYLDSSIDLSIFSRILKFGLPDLVCNQSFVYSHV